MNELVSAVKYVEISPSLPPSSVLGFGCGSMMGRVARTQSLRSVAAAIDRGITHFDVARSYGYGEAEALLGEALRGKRDRVVIASKIGRSAPRSATALRRLKPLARMLMAGIPALRPMIRTVLGAGSAPMRDFSLEAATSSLDASLAALRTDYLDILLLHDCGEEEISEELVEFLREQVRSGKIRAYGVAAHADLISPIQQRWGGELLCQFRNSVIDRNAGRFLRSDRSFVTHSPFFGLDKLESLMRTRSELFPPLGRQSWGIELIYHLMLAYALAEQNVGIVLCSMLREDHLKANLDVLERPKFSRTEVAMFADLVTAGIRKSPMP